MRSGLLILGSVIIWRSFEKSNIQEGRSATETLSFSKAYMRKLSHFENVFKFKAGVKEVNHLKKNPFKLGMNEVVLQQHTEL